MRGTCEPLINPERISGDISRWRTFERKKPGGRNQAFHRRRALCNRSEEEINSYFSTENLNANSPKGKVFAATSRNVAFQKILLETKRSKLARVVHFPVNTWDALV